MAEVFYLIVLFVVILIAAYAFLNDEDDLP